jgi:hypothetical protein
MDALASVLVVGVVLGAVLVGSGRRQLGPRPTRDQCMTLLLRQIELDARARYPSIHADAVAAHQRSIGLRLEAARSVASCQRQLTQTEVQCALGAPNVDELERCLQ